MLPPSRKPPDFSTRQLRAFLILSSQRNFTRAAAACHLSQPAFSAMIRALEDALGARLFERDTRSVHLTPEGRLFEPLAQRLLDEMTGALDNLSMHVQLRRGRVRVAALPSLAAGWLPPVFAEFGAQWPGVELDLRDALSDACLTLLRGGEVDFAVAASGVAGGSASDLKAEPLCTEHFHLVCRADHPLAQEKRLTAKKLAQHPFIQMARNSSVRQSIDAAMHPVKLRSSFQVEHLATVMGLVEAGLGISIVPSLTLFHFRRPSLVTRRLPFASLQRTVWIVERREGGLSVAARALHGLVVQRLSAMDPDV